MTAFATIVATVVSLAALAYLAATDPKRRRVFGVAPLERRRLVGPALILTFLPGPLLLGFGNGAGFVVWLGALSVAGWGVAALTPAQATRLRVWAARLTTGGGRTLMLTAHRLHAAAVSFGRWIGAVRGMPQRIAALEGRVTALEAELAAVSEPRDRSRPIAAVGKNDDAPGVGATEALRRSALRLSPGSVR